MDVLLQQLQQLDFGSMFYCFWLFTGSFVFYYPLEKRPNWKLRMLAGGLAFMALGLLFPSSLLKEKIILTILWYFGAFLVDGALCYWICRISVEETLFCAINAIFLEHIGSSVQIFLTIRLFGGQLEWMRTYSSLVNIPVYLIVWLAYGRKLSQGKEHLRVNRLLICILTVIGLTVTVVLSMRFKSNVDPELVFVLENPHAIALLETGQMYAIFFCVSMLVLQYLQQRELINQDKLAASHELLMVRQKQYEMSRETIDIINRKCHDMKHQVAALMENGVNSREKEAYRKEIEQLIEIYDLQVRTDNEALNTILMEKGLYCSMHGIRWNCAVDDSDLDFMDKMDLYVLLGNALDNAIAAVEQIPDEKQRIIQLQISRKDSFVCIRMENSFVGQLIWNGSLPETTKADKLSHGIGLKSIRAIAKRYGGYASAETENQAFILLVLIPVQKKRTEQ